MSYNIHAGIGMDDRLDNGRILEVIRRIDPDFGGLQEVDYGVYRSDYTDLVNDIRTRLLCSAVFAQAIPLGNPEQAPGGYGVAAFAKKKLYVMHQFAQKIPAGIEQRTVVIVRVQQEKPVYLVVTHLPYEKTEEMIQSRIDTYRMIERILRENQYYPAILVGDMNILPDSRVIEYLRENWTVCNDAVRQMTYPSDQPEEEIDYIAFCPRDAFKIRSVEVVPETMASDHRPIVADLEFTEES